MDNKDSTEHGDCMVLDSMSISAPITWNDKDSTEHGDCMVLDSMSISAPMTWNDKDATTIEASAFISSVITLVLSGSDLHF